jgi:uncharacterized DUF497 family protein
MRFDWDPAKNRRNIRNHGIDVYTDLRTKKDVIRQIISARRATRDEREAYHRGTGG